MYYTEYYGRRMEYGRPLYFHAVICYGRPMKYGAIIFLPCGYSIYLSVCLFSSPNLSGRRLDVYHTSTHGVALV